MSDDELHGPDEHDRDLIDGTWEDEYYAGKHEKRDWTNVYIGIVILVVLSLIVPTIAVVTQ